MSAKRAREVLGVSPLATAAELRRAFREAAKRAHPDRDGGDAEAFRRVVDAYHRLTETPSARTIQPPAATPRAQAGRLAVPPLVAMLGGGVDHRLPDGRTVRVSLPAGVREGDRVRSGGIEFTAGIPRDGQMLVRGDDLWITVPLDPAVLAKGGRIALDTPLGRRVVWITRKAGERGLVRLVGQGLPARGKHAQGHLFLRLTAQSRSTESPARALLRRFAAAWAA